ncbi:MAG: TolC family protein [Hydrogenothermaceae bacterium]|nr:TolC family protein [Hydrogenothermaceae bacterium]
MKRILTFSILCCIASSFGITFDEVISIAEKRATSIKLTEKDRERTEAQLIEAKSNILPSVNLTGTFTRWDPNYITGFTPKSQYNARIGLSQKIFDYQVFALIKLSKVNTDLQKTIMEDVKQKVKDTARKLFLTCLYNREVVKIKEESLKYWQENLKYVEGKYQAGLAAKYDYLRAQSQLQSAVADYEESKAIYTKSVEDLKRFLMLDEITEPEGEITPFIVDVQEANIENNTEIRVLKYQIRFAQSQLEYQKAANYPSLTAFLNYQINNQRNFPAGNEIWKKGYNLGVSLNWQMFDGLAKDSRVLQASIDRAKQELQLHDKLKEVQTEINKTKVNINFLKVRMKAEEENLNYAKEALRLSTERFKANVGSTLEILESQSNYLAARMNHISTVYNYNLRVFDLMYLQGK